jgi:Domain of unknown function (DUF397)
MNRPSMLVWHRSPACGTAACVEVAFDAGRVLVRDSKHPEREPLSFSTEEWRAFEAGVKAGVFTQQ